MDDACRVMMKLIAMWGRKEASQTWKNDVAYVHEVGDWATGNSKTAIVVQLYTLVRLMAGSDSAVSYS